MSTLNFNVAADSLDDMLNVKLASGWTKELLHDVATVCYNGHGIELGFVLTVIADSHAGNSYSVSEYASYQPEGEMEDTHNLLTLEEALGRIAERADVWMNGPDF